MNVTVTNASRTWFVTRRPGLPARRQGKMVCVGVHRDGPGTLCLALFRHCAPLGGLRITASHSVALEATDTNSSTPPVAV
ncbi:hypothetical protein Amsp01_100740 [Amycolatopsis sp. NBRC 101858]|nr:hypothetical protein Amsp01_100740 [Amycolatopsis sp. NBRC 101858]